MTRRGEVAHRRARIGTTEIGGLAPIATSRTGYRRWYRSYR